MKKIADQILLNIPKDLGRCIAPGSTTLDFGCGAGETVLELQHLGFQAYGCDFNSVIDNAGSSDTIKKIETDPYKLPFEDSKFDYIYSNQVFEHVQNYSESLVEIRRVLKPEGCCVHIFPARNKPIEVHVFVPFSSTIRSYYWLLFWAKIGIRNPFQINKSAIDTAKDNQQYLNKYTNYLTKQQLSQEFGNHFHNVIFCESSFLKHTKRGRILYKSAQMLPFLIPMYSAFRSRVVFMSNST